MKLAQKRADLRKAVVRGYKTETDLLEIFRKAMDKNKLDLRISQDVTDGIEQTVITLVDLESMEEETGRINRAPFNARTIEKCIRANFMLPGSYVMASEDQADYILKNATTEQLQGIVEKYQIHDLKELPQEVADALIRRIKTINKAEGRQTR